MSAFNTIDERMMEFEKICDDFPIFRHAVVKRMFRLA